MLLLTRIYEQSVTGGAAPWFPVRAPHSLLLAPFATSVGTPKRAGEGPTPERGDPKRPRLQPAPGPMSTDSPKTAPRAIVPVPPPASVPVPRAPPPPPPAVMQAPVQAQEQPPSPVPLPQAPPLAAAPSGGSSNGGAPPPASSNPAPNPPAPVPAPVRVPAPSTVPPPNTNITNVNSTVGGPGMAAMISAMPVGLQRMLGQMRAVQMEIQVLEQQIAGARAKGDAGRVELLTVQVNQRREAQARVGQVWKAQQLALQQAAAAKTQGEFSFLFVLQNEGGLGC